MSENSTRESQSSARKMSRRQFLQPRVDARNSDVRPEESPSQILQTKQSTSRGMSRREAMIRLGLIAASAAGAAGALEIPYVLNIIDEANYRFNSNAVPLNKQLDMLFHSPEQVDFLHLYQGALHRANELCSVSSPTHIIDAKVRVYARKKDSFFPLWSLILEQLNWDSSIMHDPVELCRMLGYGHDGGIFAHAGCFTNANGKQFNFAIEQQKGLKDSHTVYKRINPSSIGDFLTILPARLAGYDVEMLEIDEQKQVDPDYIPYLRKALEPAIRGAYGLVEESIVWDARRIEYETRSVLTKEMLQISGYFVIGTNNGDRVIVQASLSKGLGRSAHKNQGESVPALSMELQHQVPSTSGYPVFAGADQTIMINDPWRLERERIVRDIFIDKKINDTSLPQNRYRV